MTTTVELSDVLNFGPANWIRRSSADHTDDLKLSANTFIFGGSGISGGAIEIRWEAQTDQFGACTWAGGRPDFLRLVAIPQDFNPASGGEFDTHIDVVTKLGMHLATYYFGFRHFGSGDQFYIDGVDFAPFDGTTFPDPLYFDLPLDWTDVGEGDDILSMTIGPQPDNWLTYHSGIPSAAAIWDYPNLHANPLDGPLSFVTNVRTGELSAYDNFQFVGFGKLGDAVYGLRADGLYLLGGDDDDGDPIACGFRLHTTNFEGPDHTADSQHFKRLISVYLSIDPQLSASVTTFDQAGHLFATYFGGLRVKLSRGFRAKYWGVEVGNIAGQRLICSAMEFLIDILSRKVA